MGETGQRALVFHETIGAARQTHAYLVHRAHVPTALDHSELNGDVRTMAVESFRKGGVQVLVAVRALDEGVDVPDASVAVVAAGSRSRRQRIQRMGRVLRPAEGKQALVLTVLVRNTPEESAIGGRDAALVGAQRAFHHRWPGTPVAKAVRHPRSTYEVSEPDYSAQDRLTLLDLGVWEPDEMPTAHWRRTGAAGGYSARETAFSPNAWYSVEEVRDDIGVPPVEFDRLRPEIRRLFRRWTRQRRVIPR